MHQQWLNEVERNVKNGSLTNFNRNMAKIIHDFDTVPLTNQTKPKVGIVGEILVKYSPTANNDISPIIRRRRS